MASDSPAARYAERMLNGGVTPARGLESMREVLDRFQGLKLGGKVNLVAAPECAVAAVEAQGGDWVAFTADVDAFSQPRQMAKRVPQGHARLREMADFERHAHAEADVALVTGPCAAIEKLRRGGAAVVAVDDAAVAFEALRPHLDAARFRSVTYFKPAASSVCGRDALIVCEGAHHRRPAEWPHAAVEAADQSSRRAAEQAALLVSYYEAIGLKTDDQCAEHTL